MGSDKVKTKKEKKEKVEKRSEVDGVKKSKKGKKEKKLKLNGDFADALEAELMDIDQPVVKVVDDDGEVVMKDVPTGALVPFAVPLATDAKEVKRILRTVKKSAKHKTLRRGVKEVVKYLRKSSTNAPPSSGFSDPSAIVIIAADISPMDVISHIPVLCEDNNVPYIFVKSRAELGESSGTKRPTSVVLVSKEILSKKGKEASAEDKDEWEEQWKVLKGVVVAAQKTLRK